jgi:Tol biopolymer transport system component
VLFAHTLDGRTWVLMRAPLNGGAAEPVAAAQPPGSATRPSWSAAANLVAFTQTTGARNQIWVMRPDGKDARVITASGLSDQAFYPSWYPDGRHLVAMNASDFVIRRFDLGGGPAVAMTDPAKVLAGMASVSPDGRWIAFAGQKNLGQTYDQNRNVIWLAGEDGSLKPLEAEPLQGRAPVWSPDGSHLAFESDRGSPDGRYAVFVVAKDGTGLTQITPYELNATHPVWSPDGKHMVLAFQAGGATRVGIIEAPASP